MGQAPRPLTQRGNSTSGLAHALVPASAFRLLSSRHVANVTLSLFPISPFEARLSTKAGANPDAVNGADFPFLCWTPLTTGHFAISTRTKQSEPLCTISSALRSFWTDIRYCVDKYLPSTPSYCIYISPQAMECVHVPEVADGISASTSRHYSFARTTTYLLLAGFLSFVLLDSRQLDLGPSVFPSVHARFHSWPPESTSE